MIKNIYKKTLYGKYMVHHLPLLKLCLDSMACKMARHFISPLIYADMCDMYVCICMCV